MSLAETLKSTFPNILGEISDFHGETMVVVSKKDGLKDLASALKTGTDFRFEMLMDLTCVDYLHWEEKENRFEVLYNLYSPSKNQRLFLKVLLAETAPEVDSVTGVWPSADWFEREAWDMFGVRFKGHPNLKRILMYEEFKGHPLRKDYAYNKRQPLVGPLN